MNIAKKHIRAIKQSHLAINIWAIIAYSLSVFSYLLLATVLFDYIATTSLAGFLLVDQSATSQIPPLVATHASVLVTMLAYVMTGVVCLLALYIILTLPFFIARYYSRGLRRLMGALHVQVTIRTFLLAKVLVLVVPLVSFTIISFMNQYSDMTFASLFVTSVAAVVFSGLCFYVQAFIAKRNKLAPKYLW